MRACRGFLSLVAVTALYAQLPQGLDLQALRQAASAQGASGSAEALPSRTAGAQAPVSTPEETARQLNENENADLEIQALKRRERGPRRFGADLFQTRQRGSAATEGGIADDYVLGTGDRLNLNVFGSATFDLPVQVDGRGEIVIPKVGTAKVGGLTLGKAKAAVQGLLSRNFSKSSLDLQVTKLREVRVFVMGEVYRPGSYLVSSLSSLVNVLSLAGGPTAVGSYRDIRVMRGGRLVFSLDLYPLRAEGLGNPNAALQSGDTVFVPMAQNQVTLEGTFARVALAPVQDPADEQLLRLGRLEDEDEALLEQEIFRLEVQLAKASRVAGMDEKSTDATGTTDPTKAQDYWMGMMPKAQILPSGSETKIRTTSGQEPLALGDRLAAEARLAQLTRVLAALKVRARGDHRLRREPAAGQEPVDDTLPEWRRLWELKGVAPRMVFEMKVGETAGDALRYAGGLLPDSSSTSMTLRHRGPDGTLQVVDVPVAGGTSVALGWGDVLSALPRRGPQERAVTVLGWVRVPGLFARAEGLRVGDLLARESQILPDTFLGKGEIVRTATDGTTSFLSFDVTRALQKDPTQNLPLQDRDRVELYRLQDLRLPKTVKLLGPVTRPGLFGFHEGMRASDLIFRAGIPLKSADRYAAELARSRNGKPSEVTRLDLAKLLFTEAGAPVIPQDEAVNPLLQADDQISLFEKPDFRVHRTVRVLGQVARPGSYSMDTDRPKLSQLIQRAGGFTLEAMPKAGIFLRSLGGGSAAEAEDPEKLLELLKKPEAKPQGTLGPYAPNQDSSSLKILAQQAQDPRSKGVNDILERLNETRRLSTTGQLLRGPLMHGLLTGSLTRMVVNFDAIAKGSAEGDVELQDGDEIIIPRATDAVYVVGETASPFATYKIQQGMKVSDLLQLAGGTTRNADTSSIRLLKADGRILDTWVNGRPVEPGDTVLVPQRFRRDTSWQENLQALTPLALILNAVAASGRL